jgi:hypothetical protein
VVWKSIKRFTSLKLYVFSMFFFLTCTFLLQLYKMQIWCRDHRARASGP